MGTQQHFAFYVQLIALLVAEPNYNCKVVSNLIDKVLLMSSDPQTVASVLRVRWQMLATYAEWC